MIQTWTSLRVNPCVYGRNKLLYDSSSLAQKMPFKYLSTLSSKLERLHQLLCNYFFITFFQMEDKTNILLLVAGMRKEVQGLVSEVRQTPPKATTVRDKDLNTLLC